MPRVCCEPLEHRQMLSVTLASSPIVDTPSTITAATSASPFQAGRYKGSTVSNKGFTSRVTIVLGKPHSNGTLTGTFTYLNSFIFNMKLRIGLGNTFHGTISTGKLAGSITAGLASLHSHGSIITLTGHYRFSGGTSSDSGAFQVRK